MEDHIASLLNGFVDRINELQEVKYYGFTIAQFKTLKEGEWETWGSNPGIYYFIRNGQIEYVGRALNSNGLKRRVDEQLKLTGQAWDEITFDPNTWIGIYAFHATDWHWVKSVEVYLIDKLVPKPTFNKRF